ncbi:hypothetical protein THAOC_24654, partial [Thalassiosira oceanica]
MISLRLRAMRQSTDRKGMRKGLWQKRVSNIQKLCRRSPKPEEPRGDGSGGRSLHNVLPLRGFYPRRAGRPSELREVSAGHPSPIVTFNVAVLHRGSRDGGAGRRHIAAVTGGGLCCDGSIM